MNSIIKLFRRIFNIREARVVFIKTSSLYKISRVKQEIDRIASFSTFDGGWVEHVWVGHRAGWNINTGAVIIVSTYREYERFIKNIGESKILKLDDETRIIP